MIAGQTQPLDAGAFARLMAPFEPFEASPVLAVAVSGGRDSLALTLLSHDWTADRSGRVVGLIVDHGLPRLCVTVRRQRRPPRTIGRPLEETR